jgi:3-hydroxyacyl-CoA dehydrogenase/enoyl-CoA hydratase/3-hydroxybutyryl-CoA epimerase
MNAGLLRVDEGDVERLEAEKESITGVVITSAKKTFFAGGDLNDLRKVTKETPRSSRPG